jgi:hypothetical protein
MPANRIVENVSIHQRLLGSAWEELPAPLHAIHAAARSRIIRGRFDIRHGTNWLARLCAWVLRLPGKGIGCDLLLTIQSQQESERWVRRFADRELTTVQWAGSDGLLHESFGCLEFTFELQIEGQVLKHVQRGVALRIAGFSVPFPASLAPEVRGREYMEGDNRQVEVRVCIPVAGPLLTYSGTILSVQPA